MSSSYFPGMINRMRAWEQNGWMVQMSKVKVDGCAKERKRAPPAKNNRCCCCNRGGGGPVFSPSSKYRENTSLPPTQ